MKIIDMHAHLWLNRVEVCKKRILSAINAYGIDEVFVSTLGGTHPDSETVEKINEATYAFAKEEPGYIRSYTYISPEQENTCDVIRRGIEDNGAIGVKLWVSEPCDSRCMDSVAELLIGYGKPILIHAATRAKTRPIATESTSVNIRNLALRYPELKIVMAHVDTNCYRGAQNVRGLDNVYVDFSGGTGKSGEVEYTVNQLGADKVVFGTDLSEVSFAVPYGRLVEAKISDEDKEKILYHNTMKLFYGKV